jgi:hypothetical protein
VFEKRVLRRICGPKRDEVTGEWRSCTRISFIFCTHPQILGKSNQIKENEVGGTCGVHGTGEKCVQGFGGIARRKETTWKTKA